MVPPKYRGDSDDWLDEEPKVRASVTAPKGRRLTPEAARRAGWLDESQANATVVEVFPKQCAVEADGTGRIIPCGYRRTAVFLREEAQARKESAKWRERAPVAVGDRVKVKEISPTEGVIEGVAVRKNRIARPAPDRGEMDIHVIVANIDALCIVSAAVDPDFSPGLVDRFLVAAQIESIPTIVCINKIDGYAGEGPPPWALYRDLGIEVHEVSAKTGAGLPEFLARINQSSGSSRVAFCGHSGVGKTSLLTALLGRVAGKVGVVSDITGKGKHTTTGAIMLRGPGEARWIDTPGVREFGLHGVTPKGLVSFFPEFHSLNCETLGCQHIAEPGCQAQGLPRYTSYLRIYQALQEEGR